MDGPTTDDVTAERDPQSPVSVPIPEKLLRPPQVVELLKTKRRPLTAIDPALTGHYYLG